MKRVSGCLSGAMAVARTQNGMKKMLELVELGRRGRQVKFTPERIEQIKNLVERGKRRAEIVELIGVTTGSLQVTCLRLGISLRRPIINNGIRPRLKPVEKRRPLLSGMIVDVFRRAILTP